jgi:osmotically-inducible protein OsmY
MVQKPEQAILQCPVCKTKTRARTCPSCREDLSLLHECQISAVASYNLGLQLSKKRWGRMLEEAKSCLHLAVALNSNFVEAYVVLGKLYAQQKHYSKAIACWSKALSIDPKSKETHDCLNSLRALLGGNEKLQLESNWRGKPLRLRNCVHFTDGHEGIVTRIIPGNKKGEFTHIVVSVGHLFSKRYLVDNYLISEINSEVVFVSLKLRELLSNMPRYRPDAELSTSIYDAISTYEPIRAIQGTYIDVSVIDGTVSLSGNVASSIIKKKAEDLALSVEGVLAVQNLLVCDYDLELALAQALASNNDSKGERVLIRSSLGVVLLEGTVKSPQSKDAVETIAAKLNGVKRVINRLAILSNTVSIETTRSTI